MDHNLNKFTMHYVEYRRKVRIPLYAAIKVVEKLEMPNNVELINRRQETLTEMLAIYNQLREKPEYVVIGDGTNLEDPFPRRDVALFVVQLITNITVALVDFKDSEIEWGDKEVHEEIPLNGVLAVDDPQGHMKLVARLCEEWKEFCYVVMGRVTGGPRGPRQ